MRVKPWGHVLGTYSKNLKTIQRHMTKPPNSPPSESAPSSSSPKKTRKATQIRSLATRPIRMERSVVYMDPNTGKVDGPYRKKLRISSRGLDGFDLEGHSKASNQRTKKKILKTIGERWRKFKSDLTSKLTLEQGKEEDDIGKEKWQQFCQSRREPSWKDVRKNAQVIQKLNTAPHVLSHGGYNLLEEKSTKTIVDPPSPIRRHMKWKMTHTKKSREMTSEAAHEIANRIDVLTVAIGRPKYYDRVRVVGVSVTIKQYFGPGSKSSCTSTSITPKELEQLTQKIRDQLEQSITKKVTRQLMLSFNQMQSHMQSQGLVLPPESEVGPSVARVSTKGSVFDPSGHDPNTVYEGSTTIYNIPLGNDQVKVSVEEVQDANACVPVPTQEVQLVGAKPDDDPLYQIRLMIPKFFLKPISNRHMNELSLGSENAFVVICPKDNVVVWFCSLHNKPDNYLKGIINMDSTIFKEVNPRLLLNKFKLKPWEPKTLKAICIMWARCYLKVKNEILGV
ncbi:hypothetical protein HKD37_03G007137 [Glycine soja]